MGSAVSCRSPRGSPASFRLSLYQLQILPAIGLAPVAGHRVNPLSILPEMLAQLYVVCGIRLSCLQHVVIRLIVNEDSQACAAGGPQIFQLWCWPEKQNLLDLIDRRIDERDVTARQQLPRPLYVACKAVACASGRNRVIVVRGNEIRDRNTLDVVCILTSLARITGLYQVCLLYTSPSPRDS